jgi:glutathione S-transferase
MQLYNSIGPNPRVVRMFAAEHGVVLPLVPVDLRAGENRQPAYLIKNPTGQLPCLELDDGTMLSEITAICEYLDEISPGASLIGTNPQERATTRMWVRRIDLNIVEPMIQGFRFAEGLKLFQDRVHCIPHAAGDLKAIARENLAWFDRQMAAHDFVSGSRLTLADIMLFCFLDFGARVGQAFDSSLLWVPPWFARMEARRSAGA